jgi:hypothetical protein
MYKMYKMAVNTIHRWAETLKGSSLAALFESAVTPLIMSWRASLWRHEDLLDQGCQIFVATTYQNGKNIPNIQKIYQIFRKYTKYSENIPNIQKIYQILRKYPENTQNGHKICIPNGHKICIPNDHKVCIPNGHKCTKWPRNIPKCSIQRPS